MKCPMCEKDSLRGKLLEAKLRIQECTGCGGYRIPYNEYWRWVEKQDPPPAEHPFKEIIDAVLPERSQSVQGLGKRAIK